MNLPNRLTVMRMILVPFFVAALLYPFPHHFLAAFVLFAVASYTDHLDGKIARKRNLITNFGKFMDPLADKVMVLSAMVCLVSLDLADVWIVVLMLAREFMVTSIRLVAADRGRVIAANIWGKAKTVSQIIAILAVLLMQYLLELGGMGVLPLPAESGLIMGMIGDILLAIAAFFTVLSGLVYLRRNWDILREGA
ncbi:MAG: CDP-diacylglycerol--glycerol-3-phosphate 3-phosphatidyltransferase [Acutalibacteraceae bacterium]|nr:CDP-diacylglycerol--glycerol-3-phosphate 3-phosphatidyltransferase [Bacillota bacterium]